MSQTELLFAAKEGDEQALRELYYQYLPLVYSTQNKYFLRDFDEQDWIQEGFIAFYDCVRAFESGFGTTLGALFKRCFENRIRSFVRKECAYKRKSNQQAVSLEQKVSKDGVEYLNEPIASGNPLEHLLVNENFEECKDLLSDLEKEAFSRYALGTKKPLERSEQALRSAYDRSRRKIICYLQQN